MGILANNLYPDEPLASLPSDVKEIFANLLAESEKFYSARLLALNPSSYAKPEEFISAWTRAKAQLETINDLISIIRKE